MFKDPIIQWLSRLVAVALLGASILFPSPQLEATSMETLVMHVSVVVARNAAVILLALNLLGWIVREVDAAIMRLFGDRRPGRKRRPNRR